MPRDGSGAFREDGADSEQDLFAFRRETVIFNKKSQIDSLLCLPGSAMIKKYVEKEWKAAQVRRGGSGATVNGGKHVN